MTCPYALRPGLTKLPARMAKLPLDTRGYPIPFFVGELNGATDFRVVHPEHMAACIKDGACWVCGEKLFREKVFVIGPMCSLNRISAEPPSHRECAEWSAANCPFLARPHMTRREGQGLPEWLEVQDETSLAHNPGVVLVWYTREFKIIRPGKKLLWEIGAPFAWQWVAEGRKATRPEVLAALAKGLVVLREYAESEGPEALAELDRRTQAGMRFFPRA